MDETAKIKADHLELPLLNPTAIRAALEALYLWVSQRGSIHIHDNIMAALMTLDTHAHVISIGIERLRALSQQSCPLPPMLHRAAEPAPQGDGHWSSS